MRTRTTRRFRPALDTLPDRIVPCLLAVPPSYVGDGSGTSTGGVSGGSTAPTSGDAGYGGGTISGCSGGSTAPTSGNPGYY